MKVCKYCGGECRDSVEVCPSCGAKEFDNKCENCGKVFKSEFCPNCGTKAGTKAKVCPKCGREYFTNACPDCGYIPQSAQPASNVYENSYAAPKRKTWLWVLGWIFIFPVPLTIILTRRENNLNTAAKVTLIVLAWAAFFTLAYLGQSDDETQKQAQSETVTVTQQQETETTTQIEYE